MNNNDLFTTTLPEDVGISSKAIVNFLNRIEKEQINMHGFLLLRKGKIAAEGYWTPYSQTSKHRMYSISKSFVALAIGLMIDEGKLSLHDRVAKFFPDKLPDDVHPYLAETTIRDLLMMAGPHKATSYTQSVKAWADTFFEKKPSHSSGTIFNYDTSATVILNTIVEKISGTTFLEYMRDKFLDPIGFSKDTWCVQTPEGTSWGGSGVICTLRDMAKVAYVCLNKGRWQDKQLISEQYIAEATSKQIDNSIINELGYGYQIWIEKNNGFSFRGMGSQFAFCFPDQDIMLACISDTQIINDSLATKIIRDAFYEEIFANISDESLPVDPSNQQQLTEKIQSLQIQPENGEHTSSYVEKTNGKWFHLHENPMKITRLRFIFHNENEGLWEYENESGLHQLE